MNDSRRALVSIPLLAFAAAVLVLGGYLVFFNRSVGPGGEQPEKDGVVGMAEESIRVTHPSAGEKLEIGKAYEIRWGDYSGTELLTIALRSATPNGKIFSRILTSDAPAAGSYRWIVTSEQPDNIYTFEIYPAGARELAGRSGEFAITGEPLLVPLYPRPDDRVNATRPLLVTGQARKVFNEGEFDVAVTYPLGNQKMLVDKTFATCSVTGQGCDWTSGKLMDFKATLDLSNSPVCYVNMEFYARDDRDEGVFQPQPFYVMPLMLYGNGSCR